MSSTISCPSCQRTLRVPESLLGQAVKCPTCSHTFTAPDSAEEEAPRRSVPVSDRPSRRPAPPPDDDYDDEPRPSKRRARYEDDDYDDEPRRRRSSREKPGKVQAIAIMILVGGIIACLKVFAWDLWVGIASSGICCIPGIYSLVLGIMAIVKGSQLLGAKGYLQPPPSGIGIMMIINIITFDVINLTLGILVLIFLSDPEVKEYYRG